MRRYSNLSKFFYDIAKLSFGGLLVGFIVSSVELKHRLVLTILGFCLTCILVIVAFLLDKEGVSKE